MSLPSTNTSILRLLLGLLALAGVAILFAVAVAITNQVQDQVSRDLKVGQQVFHQAYRQKEQLLYDSTTLLTSDFGFKSAVATSDAPTINSVLENHGRRINASLMALISLDGELIASTQPLFLSQQQSYLDTLLRDTLQSGGSSAIITLDGRPYQIMTQSVDTPDPMGIAMIGFELGQSFVSEFREITQLEIAITIRKAANEMSIIATDPMLAYSSSPDDPEAKIKLADLLGLTRDKFLSRTIEMPAPTFGESQLTVRLGERLYRLLGDFRWLQMQIVLIIFMTMVFSGLIGAIYAGKLTRPIVNFVRSANRIAEGNYGEHEQLDKPTRELETLGQAFDSMQAAISKREKKISYQASHDQLTDVYNRHTFEEILQNKLNNKEEASLYGLVILGFREISDAFGSVIADNAIKITAERVKTLGGEVGRLDGAQLVWLPTASLTPAQLELIRNELETPLNIENTELNIKVGIGHIALPEYAGNAEVAIRRLRVALDETLGKSNRLCNYQSGMEDDYLHRLIILEALDKTLNSGGSGMSMHYQPKLDLTTGNVTSVEALMRWHHESLGPIPAEQFIVLAERAGLVHRITQWVIRAVIADIVRWEAQNWGLKVAINLSVHDLGSTVLLTEVGEALHKAGLPPDILSFEITESDLMSEPENGITVLGEFRARGYELSIDDFGTGYSSLAYLKSMPVNALKIDKSFVLKMDQNPEDQALVKTIINIAKQFELSTVAEGVETAGSLELLKEMGCDFAQGYHISRPLPAGDVPGWLSSFHANRTADQKWAS